jgi:hypothetical protein
MTEKSLEELTKDLKKQENNTRIKLTDKEIAELTKKEKRRE